MAALKSQDYVFVGIQILLGAAYGYVAFFRQHPLDWPLAQFGWVPVMSGALFMGLAVVQIRRHITMFPTPKEQAVLIRSGAFSRVRHPIYSGILLMAFGGAWVASSWLLIGFSFLLWGLFYVKSNYEEQRLSAFFSDYPAYMQVTGKFFPKLK